MLDPADRFDVTHTRSPRAGRPDRFRTLLALVLFGLATGGTTAAPQGTPESPLPIRVAIVTMFEIGADEGDQAGEFQLWKTRLNLDTRYPLPHAHHDLYVNEGRGILGMVTGIGTSNSAGALMAVGLDPRFDFSRTYWLIVGIAGVDPADASLGSAAWAEYLVDADLAHLIDPREMPEGWTTGFFPRGARRPYDPRRPDADGEVFVLNRALARWAYDLTRNIELPDNEILERRRAAYEGYPNAQKPPFVLIGDQLAGMTYWHGALMNEWANDWVAYWTKGEGEYVTTAMEDTGSYRTLKYLDAGGRVDADRVMVLRTASNFDMQPPGLTAVESLLMDHGDEGYEALGAALESGWLVGSRVVETLLEDWDTYAEIVPAASDH